MENKTKVDFICRDCNTEVYPRCMQCDYPEPKMSDIEHQQIHDMCGMDLANLMESYGVDNFELAKDIIKRTEAAYALGYVNGRGAK